MALGNRLVLKHNDKMEKKMDSTEFKQYYNDDLSFHSERMVYFSQCNPNGNISLYELLKVTSDVAVEDFNRRNMSRSFLADNGIAILVSRDSFRMHKYPRENEKMVIHTWEEKSEPLQFVRAFEIDSISGEKLVSGITSWLLVDLNSRRIMPIKKFDALGFRKPTEKVTEHDCLPYGKISVPEDAPLMDERIIRFSDMDANGHTNNAKYAAFATDALPEIYQRKEFKDFRLNFSKEALLGQKLKIFGTIDDENKRILQVGKTEDGVSFEAEFKW